MLNSADHILLLLLSVWLRITTTPTDISCLEFKCACVSGGARGLWAGKGVTSLTFEEEGPRDELL